MNTRESLDGRFPGNIIEMSKKERDRAPHLTVKPVELVAHVIRLFTMEGQTIFDPFMGSGSHGVAAIENRRNFVGFEIEPKYFSFAKNRLENMVEKFPHNI